MSATVWYVLLGAVLFGGLLWALLPAISTRGPLCNGRCRKGAPDPRCPLHGKGGKA